MGRAAKEVSEGRQHNVMEIADFEGKPFPCPVCNMALRLKITCKQKPCCTCLECGIQIFFRGQTGIKRLHKMIESENAVAAEFSGPQRAILLFNELQGLKRQKKALDDEQGIFSYDSDRQEVIDVLEAEIKRIRSELTRAKKDGGKKK